MTPTFSVDSGGNPLSVGSVCSGVGGFDQGFTNAGYRTLWLCEYDPWRRKVLNRHWPGVPVHPDLTTLDPDDLERPDVLIGGTPCQDLSVAGQRAGLDGGRSSLFWDFMRLRNHLAIEWCVWENVAGALSSNDGLDFAQVLAAMVGADVAVPAAGWSGAGVAAGPWGGCAWRVLDAQHFGVPQRRRRVFVVGRLGGACPPEVLLERTGGGGDSAAGRGAGARVAAPLTRGSARPGVSEPGRRQEDDINLVAGPLTRRYAKGINTTMDDGAMVAHTLRAEGFDASEDGTGRGTPLTVVGGDRVPDDREPQQREQRGDQPDAQGRERSGDSVPAGVPAGLNGAALDADGMRAPDGLAGRMDVATVTAFDWQAGDPASDRDDNGKGRKWIARAGDYTGALGVTRRDGITATGLVAGDRCAFDPQPDGRRYAACGDGVVAPVSEWIARRLAEVAAKMTPTEGLAA